MYHEPIDIKADRRGVGEQAFTSLKKSLNPHTLGYDCPKSINVLHPGAKKTNTENDQNVLKRVFGSQATFGLFNVITVPPCEQGLRMNHVSPGQDVS